MPSFKKSLIVEQFQGNYLKTVKRAKEFSYKFNDSGPYITQAVEAMDGCFVVILACCVPLLIPYAPMFVNKIIN